MRISKFIQLNREQLLNYLSRLDWAGFNDDYRDPISIVEGCLLTRDNRGYHHKNCIGIFKKGCLNLGFEARIYGLDTVRMEIFQEDWNIVCIDYNFDKKIIRRIIYFSKDAPHPVWLSEEEGLDTIDWNSLLMI